MQIRMGGLDAVVKYGDDHASATVASLPGVCDSHARVAPLAGGFAGVFVGVFVGVFAVFTAVLKQRD